MGTIKPLSSIFKLFYPPPQKSPKHLNTVTKFYRIQNVFIEISSPGVLSGGVNTE